MKFRRKKNIKRRKISPTSTLIRTLAISFLVHAAVIGLVPSVDILAPAPEYIEIEATLFDMAGMDITGFIEQSPEDGDEYSRQDISEHAPRDVHIPTMLDPIAPEMVADSNDDPSRELSTPEFAPQIPESLEVVKVTDHLKPSSPQSLIEPFKDKFAPLKNVTKEPSIPVNQEEPSVTAEREIPEEVITTAEMPYEEVVPPQDQEVKQEILPAAARFMPSKLSEREEQRTITMPAMVPPRSSVEIPPPVVNKRHIQSMEQHTPEMPRLRLPEAKDLPEIPPDDVVIQANEIEGPSESDVASMPSSFSEDYTGFPKSEPMLRRAVPTTDRVYTFANLSDRERSIPATLPRRLPLPETSQTHPSKVPVQAPVMAEKVIPAFQNFSSTPAITRAIQRNEEMTAQRSDPQEKMESLPEIRHTASIALSAPADLRAIPVISPSRSKSVLQNLQNPTLPSILSRFTSEEKLTSVEMAFLPKEISVDGEESVLQASQFPVSDQHSVQKSPQSTTLDEPERLSLPKPRESVTKSTPARISLPDRIQRSSVFGGEMSNAPLRTKRPPLGLFVPKEETNPEFELPRKILRQDDSIKQAVVQERKDEISQFRIEGPASKREVIYKPLNLPRLNIDMEVDIRLKFWVLPDGTVGEVIPLQRGDVRLERAAIQYLKSWRFTPAAPNSPKVWGIIPIKYKLR